MHSCPLITDVLYRSFDYPRAPYLPRWIDLRFPDHPDDVAERKRRGTGALLQVAGMLGALTSSRVP